MPTQMMMVMKPTLSCCTAKEDSDFATHRSLMTVTGPMITKLIYISFDFKMSAHITLMQEVGKK